MHAHQPLPKQKPNTEEREQSSVNTPGHNPHPRLLLTLWVFVFEQLEEHNVLTTSVLYRQ